MRISSGCQRITQRAGVQFGSFAIHRVNYQRTRKHGMDLFIRVFFRILVLAPIKVLGEDDCLLRLNAGFCVRLGLHAANERKSCGQGGKRTKKVHSFNIHNSTC